MLIVALILMGRAFAQESSSVDYVIGINSAYSDEKSRVLTEALFNTMYAPLGIRPKLQFLPSKRGLQLANKFEIDAEAGRVPNVAAEYPNLLPVQAPMIEHVVYWFCLEPDKCQKNPNLSYAIVGGFQAAYPYCEKYKLSCLFEHNVPFMGQLLANDVVDVLIGNKKFISRTLCASGLSRVYYRKESDLTLVSYHLVNQQHEDKLAALAESIRNMHQNGDFDAFEAYINEVAKDCKTEFIPLD